jgi:hypothetical protein
MVEIQHSGKSLRANVAFGVVRLGIPGDFHHFAVHTVNPDPAAVIAPGANGRHPDIFALHDMLTVPKHSFPPGNRDSIV